MAKKKSKQIGVEWGDLEQKLALVDKLKSTNEKRAELLSELDKSVVLKTLVPDAFKGGSATVRWSSRFPHKWPDNYWMRVIAGNGEETLFHLADYIGEAWVDALKPDAIVENNTRKVNRHIQRAKEA